MPSITSLKLNKDVTASMNMLCVMCSILPVLLPCHLQKLQGAASILTCLPWHTLLGSRTVASLKGVLMAKDWLSPPTTDMEGVSPGPFFAKV